MGLREVVKDEYLCPQCRMMLPGLHKNATLNQKLMYKNNILSAAVYRFLYLSLHNMRTSNPKLKTANV